MKTLMAAMFALALSGGAVADNTANDWVGIGKVHGGDTNGTYGKTHSASNYFDGGRVNVRNKDLNRAVPSTTRFQITGTAFFDSPVVIPYTAMGINQRDAVRIELYSNDGSTTNFCYVGWFSQTGGASTDQAFAARQSIYGGIRNDQRNKIVFDWLAPSNKTGTLYIATADVLAQGIQRFEMVVWSRTNTR